MALLFSKTRALDIFLTPGGVLAIYVLFCIPNLQIMKTDIESDKLIVHMVTSIFFY